MKNKILLAKMTTYEVAEQLKESDIAVLCVGAIEQHGPALPLDTDTFNCYEVAKRACEVVADDVKPVLLPPIWTGFSWLHMDFPGTITLKENTLIDVIVQVCKSLIHHGFRKIVLLQGHGGNKGVVRSARYILKIETDAFVIDTRAGALAKTAGIEIPSKKEYHSGFGELSMYLYLGEDAKFDKRLKEIPEMPAPEYFDVFGREGSTGSVRASAGVPIRIKEWTNSGVWGDPTEASRESGEKLVNGMVEGLAIFLRRLKATPLEELIPSLKEKKFQF